MKHSVLAASFSALALMAGTTAYAQSAGDWSVGVGLGYVQPADDNGSLAGGTLDADIGDDVQLTLTAEYFIWDNIGLELLAATPFEHDIKLNGVDAGSVRHLPPTLSLQYHFDMGGNVKPFIGAGINFTGFWDEETKGPLAGTSLSIKNSFGLALHAGVDFKVSDHGALRTDVRWIDIDADVKVNGTKVGTVNIDPVVFGVSYVHTF